MFAVIRTGGKQYRVSAQDVITIDKIAGAPGEIVEFGEVLVLGGENVQVGLPTVAGATVAAEVVEQGRGEKVVTLKKRRRKNSRRKRGHRQEFTMVRITEILTEGRKPTRTIAAGAEVRPEQDEGPSAAASLGEGGESDPIRGAGNEPQKEVR